MLSVRVAQNLGDIRHGYERCCECSHRCHIKQEASVVLAAMGLTVSDAFPILLKRVARENALPFEPLTPNETTIAASREARAGDLKSFVSVEDLTADLNAKD